MAEELGWSVEEVQLHAYQYLLCLMEAGDVSESDDNVDGGEKDEKSGNPWSTAECVLFDSLLATYKTNDGLGNSGSDRWEETIAASIPGKTARDVRRRYHEIYGNKK